MTNIHEKIKKKKLFVFDLDGTLVDSISVWDSIDQTAISFAGDTPRDTFFIERENFLHECKSHNLYQKYEKYLYKSYNFNISLKQFSILRKELSKDYITNKVTLRIGVKEILDFLKVNGYNLALATTSDRITYDIYTTENQHILNILNFNDYFGNNVMTEESVKQKKPSPEVYIKIAEQFNLSQDDIVIIEDSKTGVTAAKKAGIDCICINEEHSIQHLDFLVANSIAYINSYDDLLNMLR